MADLLTSAAAKGHHLASMTRVLGQMLNHYDAPAMQEAVLEAQRRDVPHYNAVRLALKRTRQERQNSPLIVPQLSERAQRMDMTVQPHRLDAYDDLQASGQGNYRQPAYRLSELAGHHYRHQQQLEPLGTHCGCALDQKIIRSIAHSCPGLSPGLLISSLAR